MENLNETQAPRGRLLRRRAMSAYLEEVWGLRCREQTLAKYAVEGRGPPFRRFGRAVVYDTADADDWARSRLTAPMRSTSGLDEAAAA